MEERQHEGGYGSNNMSVSAASREFKVPRKTLDDRIRGRVAHGKKPGRTTILTSAGRVPSSISSLYGGAWLSFNKNNGQSLCLGYSKVFR